MPRLTHLHVSKGIVVFSGAEGVELVAGAKEALHHDSVGGRRAHVVLTQELQQVLVVVPCTPRRGLSGCRQCCGSVSGPALFWRIRIRIRILTFIECGSDFFHLDVDPDPNPNPSFNK